MKRTAPRLAAAALGLLAVLLVAAAPALVDLGTSRCSVSLIGTETVGARTYAPSLAQTVTFTNGEGASKGEKASAATVTLVGGAAQDIALTSSATFKDASGAALTFTKIKAIGFKTAAANAAAMVIGDAAANPWDDLFGADGTITLPPNSSAVFLSASANGWPVSASDVIKVDGDGTDSVEIFVLGEN